MGTLPRTSVWRPSLRASPGEVLVSLQWLYRATWTMANLRSCYTLSPPQSQRTPRKRTKAVMVCSGEVHGPRDAFETPSAGAVRKLVLRRGKLLQTAPHRQATTAMQSGV